MKKEITVESRADNAEEPPFESMLSLATENKINVLLALMDQVRASVRYWTKQSYTAVVWSIGLMASIIGFWLLNDTRINTTRSVLLIATVLFGSVTQYYLHQLRSAFSADRRKLIRVEACLRLYDKDTYLKGQPLFKYRSSWIDPRQARHLAVIHGIVLLFTAVIVFFV